MYASEVKGRRLNFCVSGMLWQRSLVMKDLETGSLWSHILGEAMRGRLKGTRLETLPAVMTSWEEWRREHPDTTVIDLSRTADRFTPEFQKRPNRFVLGVGFGDDTVAYPFDILARRQVVNDELAGEALAVVFNPETTAARVFVRELEGKTLKFQATSPGRMKDAGTESLWETRTGRCVEGKLKGKALEERVGIVSFGRAWFQFHPNSRIYGRN